jgi:hypothetical protein
MAVRLHTIRTFSAGIYLPAAECFAWDARVPTHHWSSGWATEYLQNPSKYHQLLDAALYRQLFLLAFHQQAKIETNADIR